MLVTSSHIMAEKMGIEEHLGSEIYNRPKCGCVKYYTAGHVVRSIECKWRR